MITLYAYRQQNTWYSKTTILKDKDGKVKAIFNNSITQPKRGTKVLTVNCCKYLIDWTNVPNYKDMRPNKLKTVSIEV